MGACRPPPSVAACCVPRCRTEEVAAPAPEGASGTGAADGSRVPGAWLWLDRAASPGELGMHGGVPSALPPQLWPCSAFSECSLRSGLPL